MSTAARSNAVALQKQLGTEFDIDIKRYTLLKSAGKGAFGTVVAAKDSQSGDTVAIKKILRVFENSTAAKRVLREIKFMRHMRHPNVRFLCFLFLFSFPD
jgi:mitogen-activated protein kinase 7